MRRNLHCLTFIFLFIPGFSAALSGINELEQRLVSEGESPTILFALSKGYLSAGDASTAMLYLEYLEGLTQNVIPKDQINTLRDIILKTDTSKIKAPINRHSFIGSMSFGFDTNANQGSKFEFVSLDLDSGESIDLLLDDKNKQASSFFSTLGITYNYLPDKIDAIFSSAIESRHYPSSTANDSKIIRAGIYFKTHSLTAFHYDSDQPLNGLIYLGHHNDWKWLLRHQSDRNIFGLSYSQSFSLPSSELDATFSTYKDTPLENRAGGTQHRISAQFNTFVDNLKLGYKIEAGRDSEAFNAIFYPRTKDNYVWHTLNAEYPIIRNKEMNLSFNLQLDNKSSEIDINSWKGASASLLYRKLF